MAQSFLLMKLRRNWPLVLAIIALILAILFRLFTRVVDFSYFMVEKPTVNYWEIVNTSAFFGASIWFCIGVWVILPFIAVITWLRHEPVTAVITFLSALLASILMCSIGNLVLTSDTPSFDNLATVVFDNHVYHLAHSNPGRNFDISPDYYEMYECDVSDTQCRVYWTADQSPIFIGESPKLSLVVDSALNQLQIISDDEVAFRLDKDTLALPKALFTSEPITSDNVEQITDQLEMAGKGGNELAWSPMGDRLASVGLGHLWLYIFNSTQLSVHPLTTRENITGISFNRSSTILATTDWLDGPLRLWNLAAEQVIQTMPISYVGDVAFNPQADVLAFGRYDDIVLYDTATNKEIVVLKDKRLHSLEFSPDGNMLAATVYDYEIERYIIHLWDTETTTLYAEIALEHQSFFPSRIVFSPDGNTIAYASDHQYAPSESGSQIHIWDIANKTEKLHINFEPYQWINSLAFNHDGTLLVSGNSEGAMEVWNPDTGEIILSRTVGEAGIRSLAFNPDGNVLATSSNDGVVHLWTVKP